MPVGTTGCGAGLGPSEAGQAHPATKPGGPSLSSHHPHPIAAQLAPQRCGLDALLSTHCSRHFYGVPLRVARWGCSSGGAHSGSRTQPGLLWCLPVLAPHGGHIPLSPSLSPHGGVTALLRSPQGFNVWSSRSPFLPPSTNAIFTSCCAAPATGPLSNPPGPPSGSCPGRVLSQGLVLGSAQEPLPSLQLSSSVTSLLSSPRRGFSAVAVIPPLFLARSPTYRQRWVGPALCHVGLPPSSVFPGSKLRLNPDLFFNAQTRESLLACDFSYF